MFIRKSVRKLTTVSDLSPAIIITGGSGAIGLALAKRFLSAGHTIVLIARHQDALDNAITSLPNDQKVQCHGLALDLTTIDAPTIIERHLNTKKLYANILINNAAAGLSGPFLENTTDTLDHLLELNVKALTRLTRFFLPAIIARGHGGIINIASLGGYVPGPNQAAYYASKAYVLSLSEALAAETRGTGVRVCCVAPGPVKTEFHAHMGADRALYRLLLPELSPERVAASTYRGYRFRQRIVVPGLFNRLLFLCLRLTPHPISVAITGWLLQNPTKS